MASRTGDRDTMVASLDVYRVALELAPRDRAPLDWATTQNNLRTVLQTLRAREEGTARLEEAVATYRAALEAFANAGHARGAARSRANVEHAEDLLSKRRCEPR